MSEKKVYFSLNETSSPGLVTNGDSHDHVSGDGAAITEAALSFTDLTTADASASKHGLCPKLSGVATEYLDGSGGFSTPAGSHMDAAILNEQAAAPSTLANHFQVYGITTFKWDAYTKLMLHCDGTDGSTTFTDEIGKTVTRNGSAQVDTAQKVFGSASALFDGNGDYLSLASSADFNMGSGDFTYECRVRFASKADFACLFNSTTGYLPLIRTGSGGDNINILMDDYASVSQTFSHTFNTDTWYHIAVIRASGTVRVFVDGNQIGSDWSCTVSIPERGLYIGCQNNNSAYCINGWLDEIRVSKGIARWTSNFTSPISAYAADVASGYALKCKLPDGTEKTVTLT